MTSHITADEYTALRSLGWLPRTPQWVYADVSKSQLSTARLWMGCRIDGMTYTYVHATDELIRDDVLKQLALIRRDARQAVAADFAARQGDLLQGA